MSDDALCALWVSNKFLTIDNTAEAGRLIPTPAALLHLAALLCQYSTARLVFRQVFSLLSLQAHGQKRPKQRPYISHINLK